MPVSGVNFETRVPSERRRPDLAERHHVLPAKDPTDIKACTTDGTAAVAIECEWYEEPDE